MIFCFHLVPTLLRGGRSLQLQTPQTESKLSKQQELLPPPPKASRFSKLLTTSSLEILELFLHKLRLFATIPMIYWLALYLDGRARALPPKFRSVDGWKDCMGSKDIGTRKAHCLPLDKPELCKRDSWFQLNWIRVDTGDVKLCNEKGNSFHENS